MGALATGLFASTAINSAGANGLIHGNAHQVLLQLTGIVATWLFSGIGTFILLWVVDKLMGIRVTKEEEIMGLDLALHHESAYPETLTASELPKYFGASGQTFGHDS
ncbi:hypothetical protein GCM10025858_12260 [Alicyclobacillus sacchari]|nr:hypothetical protein [Alicyclobacillus sacchari]GMA56723.1 hypothetical protein GCM10025858_12260 [Alicyclobacillus sacchari]